jgi:hypothetical protein
MIITKNRNGAKKRIVILRSGAEVSLSRNRGWVSFSSRRSNALGAIIAHFFRRRKVPAFDKQHPQIEGLAPQSNADSFMFLNNPLIRWRGNHRNASVK